MPTATTSAVPESTEPARNAPSKGMRITLWVLCSLLALQYLAAGVPKLLGIAQVAEGFRKEGFSDAFRLFIGGCETAGAIGLLIPRLRLFAAPGLMIIMIGALSTHLRVNDPFTKMIPAVLCFLLLGFVAWESRPRR